MIRNRRCQWAIGAICLFVAANIMGQSTSSEENDLEQMSENNVEQDAEGNIVGSFSKGPPLFFNAETSGLSKDGQKQMFSGQVVAIGAGVLITADYIEMDRSKNLMWCSGHVIIITNNQVFTGDKIEYWLETGNFRITNATMIANEKEGSDSIAKRILGFTTKEIEFEKYRKDQLKKISEAKENLKAVYRNHGDDPELSADSILREYARLLEQEDLIREQENIALAKMAKRRRDLFKSRRKYWGQKVKLPGDRRKEAFFRLEGHTLERIDETIFKAQQALWTPCNCDEDDEPAWGFRADKIEAQTGGYVDLHHPVLEIKGVPILYLPYLKLPMKNQRQSGFIMPRFAENRLSGTVYSQPIYFLLDEKSDATLTTEFFQNRGNKLALEMRYQAKKYSGWEFQIERIRDRLWLNSRALRKDMINACEGLSEEQCSLEKQDNMKRLLASPGNTWRGQKKWSGLQIFAPRLSFVTTGRTLSDHRYLVDLTLPDPYRDTFEIGFNATYFSTASGRFHMDGQDVYLGAGSDFGDNVKTDRSYDGYQIPARFKMQSRMFSLLPANSLGIKSYGQVSVNHIQIMDFNDERDSPLRQNNKLGTGFWEQSKVDIASSLLSDSIVSVSHFGDVEYRRIRHEGLESENSHIHTWRTGLTFNLPLDGEMPLLRSWGEDDDDKDTRYLHHLMDWAFTFSVRPVVARRGPYYTPQLSSTGDPLAPMYYFYGDTEFYNTNFDDVAREEDMMKVHRRVQFSTNHRWRSFARGWKVMSGEKKPGTTDSSLKDVDSYEVKAREELMYMLDRPVEGAQDMFGEIQNDYVWYINRYRLQDYGSSEHMTFSANIAYDFENEKIRKEQLRELDLEGKSKVERELLLAGAWSELFTNLTANAFGLSLRNFNKYNVYTHRFINMTFDLGLPTFLGSRMSLGYTIAQDPSTRGDYVETKERSVNFTTGYGSFFDLGVTVAERLRENAKPDYQTVFRISYRSFEDCWKIDLGRTKRFGNDEKDAVYLLQLSVLFLGEERQVGNLGDQMRKYLDRGEDI